MSFQTYLSSTEDAKKSTLKNDIWSMMLFWILLNKNIPQNVFFFFFRVLLRELNAIACLQMQTETAIRVAHPRTQNKHLVFQLLS